MNILLGSHGMLGSMFVREFKLPLKGYGHQQFDAEQPDYDLLKTNDWIINAIGVIKPYCDDVQRAITVNALFPHLLPAKTIQIATDCVYSGVKGNYVETDPHDALDVYGKTKSLGEAGHIKNLRCSIIGPELKNHVSLLDWTLKQNTLNGYTNHRWNGITTYHFVKIVEGILREGIELPNIQHIVPANVVSKAELLRLICKYYKHEIPITDVEAPERVDRTLNTNSPNLNKKLWQVAGYKKPPTIAQMIEELSQL